MTHVNKSSLEYYTDRLKGLVGGEITGVIASTPSEFGDVFVGLIIGVKDKSFRLWLLSDDEGNGPGSFDIEPHSR